MDLGALVHSVRVQDMVEIYDVYERCSVHRDMDSSPVPLRRVWGHSPF
jgi:hypothetical protein